MDHDSEVGEVIRDAFAALQGPHPAVMAMIGAVIDATRGQAHHVSAVEAAFRDAGKAIVSSDKESARILFKVAESLAEISSYWEIPKE
jgi:hypothetical protein